MIKTGPRGGKYYITSGGKKQYLKYTKEQLPDSSFCGPAGGYPSGTYPVNTKERCSSALRYARHAPDPCGIARCVRDKCPEGTGKSSRLFFLCNIKPS